MSEVETNSVPMPENAQRQEMPVPATAGGRLAACRQERGWTVEQVASQLNLAPRQVMALENDDYPALPGVSIVRGFIRSYAKLLKIDPAPLLASIGGETVMAHEPIQPRKPLSTPFSDTRLPSMADRPGLSSKWVVGGLLIALLGVAIWAAQQSPEVDALQKTASTQVKDGLAYFAATDRAKSADEKRPETSASATMQSEPQALTPSMVTNASQSEEVNAEVSQPIAGAPAVEAAKPAADGGKAAEATATNGEAIPGKDTLVFNVREDSWVEVRRASDKSVLLARLLKAGTTETVEVSEPVFIVVGNVTGVSASLRGELVELKSGGNVARLTLK